MSLLQHPSLCCHGEVDQHGTPGRDWCAGAIALFLEPWRQTIEAQMNDPLLAAFDADDTDD